MGLVNYLHSWVDYLFSFTKLVQNRQVGWLTVDRKTGAYIREQQPLIKKLKLLLLFNPVMEWIDNTNFFRYWLHEKAEMKGKIESSPSSKKKIAPFVKFYGIDMNQFEPSDINAYNSFQEFFIRHHKHGERPIFEENDPTKAVIVADSRVVVYDNVPQARAIWIKGRYFTIPNLINDPDEGKIWDDGAVASFRLSPQDYHRYHSPVTGKVKWWKRISGDYYQVDPICLRSNIDILTKNARCALCISTKEFGQVLFVAIGASEVGTVKINEEVQKPGATVRKGQELGIFEFGGSSIIVAFENGRIEFDDDLKVVSRQAIQMDVVVGQSLGKATVPEVEGRGY